MTRGRRWIARIPIALAALVVLVVLAPPLLLRGPLLTALVRHESKSLCGTLEISGGHIGVDTTMALILQRPFSIALDGVRVREPEGDDLFRARELRLHLTLRRHPWQVVVDRARVAGGMWRMVSRGNGVPLTVALAEIPAAGRGACRAPAPPKTPGETPDTPPRLGPLFTIQAVTLHDVSLVLSFPEWGVAFDALDARGSLNVRGTRDGAQVLFDAHDVQTSREGSLRIGPAGKRETFELRFDSLSVPRLAVTGAAPSDLTLTIAEARTRGAQLSGEALFTDVLAPHSLGRKAGIVLSARWTELGQALEREPRFAAVGRRLAMLHAGARVSLRGPFEALVGSAAIDGKGVSLQAQLLPHRRYTLDAIFRALDTRPLLGRAQRAALGGRLDGRVSVSMQLGPGPRDRSVAVDRLALALGRDAVGDGVPRRWVIAQLPRPSLGVAEPSADEVRVTLGAVTLQRGELVVDPFRVQASGVAIAGHLRARAADGLALRTQFLAESRVTWRGESFRMPARLDVERNVAGDLTITPFAIANVAGGAVEVGGSLRHDGSVALNATVTRYPLAHLPGVARAHVPGQRAPLGQLLAGQLDAAFALRGTQRSPSLSGRLALANLRSANRPMGDGAITFDAIEGGTRFRGRLLDGIDLSGSFTRRAGASVHARLALAPIQSALPALRLRRASGTISADLRWRPDRSKATPPIDADASWAQPLSIWPARLPAAIEIQPARVALHDGDLAVSNLIARSSGVQATAAGHVRIDADDSGASALAGTLDVVADGDRLGPWLGAGAGFRGGGSAALGAKVSGSLRAPRVNAQARFQALTLDWPRSPVGAIRLDGPLTIDGPISGRPASTDTGPRLVIGPLLARLGTGGWVLLAGEHGPGRIQLAPERSPLPIAGIDLLVRGAGLTTREPIGGVSIRGLALALALRPREPSARTLRVTGSVHLGRTVYRIGATRSSAPAKPKAPAAHHPTALDRIYARIYADDVQIIGARDAVRAKVSYAPTVTVGVHCSINGPIAAPHISGRVRGAGLYSRIALAVADWFTSRNLRGCDFGPK